MKRKVGLLESIRLYEKNNTKVNIVDALKRQPIKITNTDIIICNSIFAEKFNDALK